MKIRLTLRHPDRAREDIAITADPATTVGEVAAAVAAADPHGRYAAAASGTPVTFEVAAPLLGGPVETLDPDDTLADVQLASGVEASIVTMRDAPRAEAAVVELLSGPDAGMQYTVTRGSTLLGRDESCDIVLSDRTVSKRHARLHVGRDRIELIDMNSANGILVQGMTVTRLELGQDQVAVLGDTALRARFLTSAAQSHFPYAEISFTRSPAVEPRYLGSEIEGADPPAPSEPQPFPWLAAAMPLILGGAMYAFTRSPLSLIFVAASPIMMLGTWMTAWSTRRRKERAERARFDTQMARLESRLAAEAARESEIRRREAVALHEVFDAVMRGDDLVWTRRPEHWSFLHLRLGMGAAPSRNEVAAPSAPDRAEPEDLARVEGVISTFADVVGVPLVEKLSDAGALGVCGDSAAVASYVRGLIAQWSGLHAHTDSVIGGVFGSRWASEFAALKWLPHTARSEDVFGGVALGDTAAAAGAVVARIEELLDARAPQTGAGPALLGAIGEREAATADAATVGERASTSSSDTAGPLPAVILLIAEDAPVDRARLIQLLERAAGRGVYPIWLSNSRSALPAACRTFVTLLPNGRAEVSHVRQGTQTSDAEVEGLGADQFAQFCRRLAMFVDAGETQTDASDVPRSVGMLQLIGRDLAVDPTVVVDRWQQNGSLVTPDAPPPRGAVPKLRAIVGQSASGAMHIDLRGQGPHALVGGTTGSGKSEFLQAWVLGMAAEYSPQRVTFLFVDYKGGAAFADCTKLPHYVGLVTDLSPHLVRRALVSLRAELHHRETLFLRKKAKDLIELEKRGDPEAPPALVIVIDEFAALVGEVPEFVDGVVDVAQRGRSLGIHLIMATQRPAGVIKDNLRANTNLRIALRMADETDSADVIGTKEAAHFDPEVPGRAAAKTGPGRLSVFQSAYAGGWSFAAETAPEVTIESFGFGPPVRWEPPQQEGESPERELGPTDQQRLVATMVEAAALAELAPPRRPWLDELAEAYDLTRLRQRTDAQLVLGVQDFPQRQAQRPVYFEPDTEGHLAVFGTGGSGKSATLRTLAIAAGITPRGGPVDVYALDFGAGGLRMLEALPHVGAVIPADAGERVARLFRMLRAELDRRAEAYAAATAGTITQYRSIAGRPDERRILVLIDGFATFRTEYEGVVGRAEVYAAFQQILTDGRAAGIHIALTADRGQAVPSALQAMIQKRVVLRMADADQYGMLGVPRDVLSPDSPPGRALVDGMETQLAIMAGTSDIREQAQAVQEFAAALRRQGRAEAPPVGALPEVYPAEELPDAIEGRAVLGLSGVDLAPLAFDAEGLFIVAGGPQSGRSNALAAIARAAARTGQIRETFLLCGARSQLTEAAAWTRIATSGSAASALVGELVQREDLNGVAVVIEGAADFASSLAELSLSDLVKRVKRGEGFIVAEGETSDWGTGFGLMGELRSSRRGVILQPDSHDGEVVFRTPFPRIVKREFPPGRGLLVAGGKTTSVQLPLVL